MQVEILGYRNPMNINKLLDHSGEKEDLVAPPKDDAFIEQFCESSDKNEDDDDSKPLPKFIC
ncbi:hypothetical protein GcM1_160008 [Golovinomyces cichoracearum]|uniref:Uncharacterized protein n=1 Tax=Golovinomyces cichoracearum TaxID=62708 RepID=A0A420J954_9PEZI|nr:hypothetical protein GcM1_160008 [Golovinomyces cichoracearum]